MKTLRILFFLLLTLMAWSQNPAQACIMPVLLEPPQIQKETSDLTDEDKFILEEFKKDKEYYDHLITLFCSLRYGHEIKNREIRFKERDMDSHEITKEMIELLNAKWKNFNQSQNKEK